MKQTIHPPDITPDRWLNTYWHPNVIARHGYGYDADCPRCYLGHTHTWAEHYQCLLFRSLRQQFGETYQWTPNKEHEMHAWEVEWWNEHAPFEWDRSYRRTYTW